MDNQEIEREKLEWEREKFRREEERLTLERRLHEREVTVEERKLAQSIWRNPLFIAIIAAFLAALGNGVVAAVNGKYQRDLEEQKSEDARILEMIKTGDPDKAAENLRFLLDAGLINNRKRIDRLERFLRSREPGTGPTLPTGGRLVGSPRILQTVLAQDLSSNISISFDVINAHASFYKIARWDPGKRVYFSVAEGTNLDKLPNEIDLGQARALIGHRLRWELGLTPMGSSKEYTVFVHLKKDGKTVGEGTASGVVSVGPITSVVGTIKVFGTDGGNDSK